MKWLPAMVVAVAGCCSRPPALDDPRTVTVQVPVVQSVPAALVADCVPEPLAGTTIDAVLARLVSVEDCLATMRDQAARLRALPHPAPSLPTFSN
jgi:hypothetical protein